MGKRTAQDERLYEEELRREEPIKSEVIAELRSENQWLLSNQARLLTSLIDANDALRVYRSEILKQTLTRIQRPGHCSAGCQRHRWDMKNGWQRVKPEEAS